MMDSEPPVPPGPEAFPDAAHPEGPSEEGRDSFLRRVFLLFFRPGTFFAEMDAPKGRGWVGVFALTYGLAYALEQVQMSQLREKNPFFETVDWPIFWLSSVPLAILAAGFVYSLGGTWYKFRVRLSGTRGADIRTVRRVYLSAAQIVAIPNILGALFMTISHKTPLAAALAEPTWLDMAFLIFPFWSLYASFRGVRTVFKTKKVATAIWFLFLPGLFVLVFLLVMVGPMAELPSPTGPEPDLDYPREYSSALMSFSYPGNWSIQRFHPDHDPERYVQISSFQDMLFEITIVSYEPDEDPGPESLADLMAEELGKTFGDPGGAARFIRWGTYKGTGRRWKGKSEGSTVEIRVFVGPLPENTYLMALEAVHQEQADMLEPGLALVRTSFRTVY